MIAPSPKLALLFTACSLIARVIPVGPDLPELLRYELRPFPRGVTTMVQMAYLSLVCVAGIMLAQTWALQRLPASTAAVIYALESVVATALAVLVNGTSEWPGPRGATGGFLVLCAIYVAEGRRRARSVDHKATSASHGASPVTPETTTLGDPDAAA